MSAIINFMDKRAATAKVNSSYTLFFLASTVIYSFVLSNTFDELKTRSSLVIIGFGLLTYFIADFIKQLYSAGQSVFLYFVTFILLPFVLVQTIGRDLPIIGFFIFILSLLTAGVLDVLYEKVFKSKLPKNVLKRVTTMDRNTDASLVKLNYRYESHFNFRSVFVATALIVAYYCLSFLLVTKR